MLALAVWTIAARETFAAVVGFVAYGLLLALVWVRLDAVDVALTEAAIGGGLSGVLLLGAAARLRATETPAAAERPAGIAARRRRGALGDGRGGARGRRARPARSRAHARARGRREHRGDRPRQSGHRVLMAFRAMDTLLEKVVLLLALVGVWSLAPDRVWGGRPGPRHQADPRRRARLPRAAAAAGRHRRGHLHLLGRGRPSRRRVPGRHDPRRHVAAGHDGRAHGCAAGRPPMAAAGADRRPARSSSPSASRDSWLGDAFLAYPLAYAKPLILAIEVAMTLTIAVTLGLLMAGAPERSAER